MRVMDVILDPPLSSRWLSRYKPSLNNAILA
jgi:hypothetical protein